MEAFKRIVRPGRGEYGDIFLCIEFRKEGELSIIGVEGPKPNGDASGGCGQIQNFQVKDYAPGWDSPLTERLRAVWDRWHLNHMQPACEHQRAAWDTREKVEVVTYKLTQEAWKLKIEAEKETLAAVKAHREPNLTETGRALSGDGVLVGASEAYFKIVAPPDADSPLSGCYEVDKRETKTAGWVTQAEHPRGLLSKPCEVCGYKYGSAWLKEEVPTDVLEFLKGLPNADKACAWRM